MESACLPTDLSDSVFHLYFSEKNLFSGVESWSGIIVYNGCLYVHRDDVCSWCCSVVPPACACSSCRRCPFPASPSCVSWWWRLRPACPGTCQRTHSLSGAASLSTWRVSTVTLPVPAPMGVCGTITITQSGSRKRLFDCGELDPNNQMRVVGGLPFQVKKELSGKATIKNPTSGFFTCNFKSVQSIPVTIT